jgi:asparagine synthase (glutamine-hydrolysing)
MEEPSAYAIEIPRMVLAQTSARRVKAVITGEGADEVFGGYPYFRRNSLTAPFSRLPLRLRRLLLGRSLAARHPWLVPLLLAPAEMGRERYCRLVGAVPAGEGARAFSPELKRRLEERRIDDGWPLSGRQLRSLSSFSALHHCEMQIRLPDFVLHTADRAAMACGVEVRVPYLDHELVELCAGIPPALKLRGSTEKYILRRAVERLLPPEICWRRKRGLMAPYVGWWRGPLPPFVAEMLSEERLRGNGYFVPAAVAGMLERHRSGRADLGHALNAILGVQVWHDLFLAGRDLREAA